MMQDPSLVWTTDLIFARAAGEVRREEGFWCVRTPSNPTFWWGSFLLFDEAPTRADGDRWEALFVQHIASHQPLSNHRAFGWLGARQGDVSGFLDRGYAAGRCAALAAQALLPQPVPTGIVIRRLRDDEWGMALAVQMTDLKPVHSEADFRVYLEAKFASYRRLRDAGLGDWYGAFELEAGMIACCGLFHDGNGLGRYQSVVTRPEWRRQGVASALVSHAGAWALAESVSKLVIVAEEEDPARLYGKLGFAPVHTPAWTLQRSAQQPAP
jgi:GNAT superfamily N-acetyltransferase